MFLSTLCPPRDLWEREGEVSLSPETVCDAIFGLAVFGVTVMKALLAEVYKKYIFEEQQSKFSPWKVLRAIGLSSMGGLNFNGRIGPISTWYFTGAFNYTESFPSAS